MPMSPVVSVAAWGLGFLALHLVFTHPPVRGPLVRRLGEGGFQGLFSLASAVLLGGFVWTWWGHRHQGDLLWMLRSPQVTLAVEALVIVSYGLVGAGLAAPAPSSAGPRRDPDAPIEVRGATGFTRHPMMMGMGGWALGHAIVNGWASDLAFFGLFAATAVLGSAHQDWRKSAERPAYARFVAQTSFFPLPRPSGFRAMNARAWVGFAAGAGLALLIRTYHAWVISL